MDNLATLTARPQRIDFGGEEHDVHPLTFEDFGTLQGWVDRQFGDPFEAVNRARREGPSDRRRRLGRLRALHRGAAAILAQDRPGDERQGRHPIGTPEADAKLLSLEGLKEQLFLSIRKGDPAFTREDAARIYRRLSPGDFAGSSGRPTWTWWSPTQKRRRRLGRRRRAHRTAPLRLVEALARRPLPAPVGLSASASRY